MFDAGTSVGMASVFLGVPEAVRLAVDPDHPKWWGKDAPVFIEKSSLSCWRDS
jgi:hypothetical protein